ncbi:GNAT family N-acetyltransferase [Bacteroides acidifaciens]|uniref:GNAT family N-acetyltransferase n=1 Tax=Bacteroides acidifaciens TaxID=85831 RepID=UPI0025976F7F|nr:GNAT family N-acetyltransferase [Bacteroides acidifaciens]
MIFSTRRLILRPCRESDAESPFKYASDPEVGPIAGWPVHRTVEESLEIIRTVFNDPLTFAVTEKGKDEAIGCIGLMKGDKSNFNITESEAEIGYWLGQPFWGRGYIPEAMFELIRYGFEELGLDCIWCGYFDGNVKFLRAQTKCGFKFHHTNPEAYFELIDANKIEHVTCLRRNEYEAGKS